MPRHSGSASRPRQHGIGRELRRRRGVVATGSQYRRMRVPGETCLRGLRVAPRQPQKSSAISASARAQATVPLTLTHSTSAWAPSPGGPSSTLGMPAAAV